MIRSALLLCALALPAHAQDFTRVTTASEFLTKVAGRDLKRLGISINAAKGGAITGSAFGGEVTGKWQWQEGYFCREMSWGSRSWGWNCQLVELGGDTVRFTADMGKGDTADLRID